MDFNQILYVHFYSGKIYMVWNYDQVLAID